MSFLILVRHGQSVWNLEKNLLVTILTYKKGETEAESWLINSKRKYKNRFLFFLSSTKSHTHS